MSRVQLALNVSDLDAAVAFYSKLFVDRAGQAAPGLRELRGRRSAAEARAHRGRRLAGQPEPPRRRGGVDRGGRRGPAQRLAGDGPRDARPRTRWRAATRCRTRCGSTTPTARRGRSTPSWATSRCPTASCAARRPGRRAVLRHRGALLPAVDRSRRHPCSRRRLFAGVPRHRIARGRGRRFGHRGDSACRRTTSASQLFENAAATAAALIAIILALGPVSGAHLNPGRHRSPTGSSAAHHRWSDTACLRRGAGRRR